MIALTRNRGSQRDGQRQRNRHRPHPQTAFVTLDHLRIVLQRAVDPVKNRIVLDFEHDDQTRLGNLECLAVRQRDVDLVGFVEGEERAALSVERAD